MSLPTTWTPIAYRPHAAVKPVIWHPAEGAIPVEEAHRLKDKGLIVMAQRREKELTALVIKASAKSVKEAAA